jgi:hypothetical protein
MDQLRKIAALAAQPADNVVALDAGARGRRGEFFAVDRRTFGATCALGLNEAFGYFVVACGTGRGNDESTWSATAIERYTGLNRKFAAPQLIQRLIENRLLVRTKDGLHPRYRLPPWSEIAREAVASEPQLLYLPNSLVTGAGKEKPLRLLREMQDSRRLQLLAAMYDNNNLAEDGGISRAVLWQEHTMTKVGQHGASAIWAFDPQGSRITTTSPLLAIYVTPELKGKARETAKKEFWNAVTAFRTTGLFEFVPHVFESDQPQAEIKHAYALDGAGEEWERELANAAHDAALACLTPGQQQWAVEQNRRLLPVALHIDKVAVIGIARLRYRPHTRMTSAWFAKSRQQAEVFLAGYREMIDRQQARRSSLP